MSDGPPTISESGQKTEAFRARSKSTVDTGAPTQPLTLISPVSLREEQKFLAQKRLEARDPSKTPLWFFTELFFGAEKVFIDARYDDQATMRREYLEANNWVTQHPILGRMTIDPEKYDDPGPAPTESGYRASQSEADYKNIFAPGELEAGLKDSRASYDKYWKLTKLIIEYYGFDESPAKEALDRDIRKVQLAELEGEQQTQEIERLRAQEKPLEEAWLQDHKSRITDLVGESKANHIFGRESKAILLSKESIGNLFAQVLDREGQLFISPKTYRYLNLRSYGADIETTLSRKEADDFLKSITDDLKNAGFDKKVLDSFLRVFGREEALDILINNVLTERIRVNRSTGNTAISCLIDYTDPDNFPRVCAAIYDHLIAGFGVPDYVRDLFKDGVRPTIDDDGNFSFELDGLKLISDKSNDSGVINGEVLRDSILDSASSGKAIAETRELTPPKQMAVRGPSEEDSGSTLDETQDFSPKPNSTDETQDFIAPESKDGAKTQGDFAEQTQLEKSGAETAANISSDNDGPISEMIEEGTMEFSVDPGTEELMPQTRLESEATPSQFDQGMADSRHNHTVVLNSLGDGLNRMIIRPHSYGNNSKDRDRLVKLWVEKGLVDSNNNDQYRLAMEIAHVLLSVKETYDKYISGMNETLPLVSIGDLQGIQASVTNRRNKHLAIVDLAESFYGLVNDLAKGGNVLEHIKRLKDMEGIVRNYTYVKVRGGNSDAGRIVQNTVENFDGDIEQLDSNQFLRAYSPNRKQAFTTILFNNIVDHVIRDDPALNEEVKRKFAPIIDPFLVDKLERRAFMWKAGTGVAATAAVVGIPSAIYYGNLPGFEERKSFTVRELSEAQSKLGDDLEARKLKLLHEIMINLPDINIDAKTKFNIKDTTIILAPVGKEGRNYKHHVDGSDVDYYRDTTAFVDDLQGALDSSGLENVELGAEELREAFFASRSNFTEKLREYAPELVTPLVIRSRDANGDVKPRLTIIVDSEYLQRLLKSPGDENLIREAALGLSFLPVSTKLSYDNFVTSVSEDTAEYKSNKPMVFTRNIYERVDSSPKIQTLSGRLRRILDRISKPSKKQSQQELSPQALRRSSKTSSRNLNA